MICSTQQAVHNQCPCINPRSPVTAYTKYIEPLQSLRQSTSELQKSQLLGNRRNLRECLKQQFSTWLYFGNPQEGLKTDTWVPPTSIGLECTLDSGIFKNFSRGFISIAKIGNSIVTDLRQYCRTQKLLCLWEPKRLHKRGKQDRYGNGGSQEVLGIVFNQKMHDHLKWQMLSSR